MKLLLQAVKPLSKILAAGAAFSFGFFFCLWFMTADLMPQGELSATGGSGTQEEAAAGQEETGAQEEVTTGQEETVLVIDPGHGGFDGGAEAADGTQEKDINLAIALKLADMAANYPVKVILTRERDMALTLETENTSKKREDLLRRKEIMKEAGADLAVSIHLNSFPQNTSVHGAQIFYPAAEGKTDEERTGEQRKEQTSKLFAESVQKALETDISDGTERVSMKKNDILLFKNPPCRIILAECGFLSNPEEAGRLKTAEYQQKLAEAIWKGINERLCLSMKEKIPVTDSANKGKDN